MATAYADKWTEGIKTPLRRRVGIALKIAAFDKLTAGFDVDADIARREKRVVRLILSDVNGLRDPVAITITANSGIDGSSTDAQIQSAVDSNFDKLTWLVDDANGE